MSSKGSTSTKEKRKSSSQRGSMQQEKKSSDQRGSMQQEKSSDQQDSKQQEARKESTSKERGKEGVIPTVTKVEFRPDGSGTAKIEWGPSHGGEGGGKKRRCCCRKKSSGKVKGDKGAAKDKSGGGIKSAHWAYSRITEDKATGYKTYEVFGKHKRRPCFRVPAGVDKVFITHADKSEGKSAKQRHSSSGSAGGSVKWDENNLESYKQIESDTETSASDGSTGHNTELGPKTTGSHNNTKRKRTVGYMLSTEVDRQESDSGNDTSAEQPIGEYLLDEEAERPESDSVSQDEEDATTSNTTTAANSP